MTYFCGDLDALKQAVSNKTDRIIIGGELVLSSLEKAYTNAEYLNQIPRKVSPPFSFKLRDSASLNVMVLKEAAQFVTSKGKKDVSLGIDHQLAWGTRTKNKSILIAGMPGAGRSLFSILVFSNGTLIELHEKTLAEEGSARYEAETVSLIEQLRTDYLEYTLFWAEPCAVPSIVEIAVVKDLYTGKRQPVRLTSKPSFYEEYGAALLVGVAAVVAYTVVNGVYFMKFHSLKNTAIEEVAALKSEYTFAANVLTALEQKKAILAKSKDRVARSKQMETLVKEIYEAMPGDKLKIMEVSWTDNKFEVVFEASRSKAPVLEQVKLYVDKIAELTNKPAKLVSGGWREFDTTRLFRIEGELDATKS